jgi:Flp pilus assembly protein TadG
MAMLGSLLQGLGRNEEGTALIEGALIVPVLCIMLFGVYEFSWYFYQQHLISTGLRDAARYLSRASSRCNPNSSNWLIDQAYARNLAATGSIAGGTPRVKEWSAAAVRVTCTPVENPVGPDGLSAFRGGPFIFVVTASTRFPDPGLGFLRLLGLSNAVISVSHSERVIGPG